jgi:hypothetical protein
VYTNSDPAHCGACGKKCRPGERCIAGACTEFLQASGCWECGNGNAFPVCCETTGGAYCIAAGTSCP